MSKLGIFWGFEANSGDIEPEDIDVEDGGDDKEEERLGLLLLLLLLVFGEIDLAGNSLS